MIILFFVIATMLPLYTMIKQERKVLADRRTATLILHDELQQIIYVDVDHFPQTKKINEPLRLEMTFTKNSNEIKGCAKWTNEKEQNEQICLYGLHEK